jgi:hypothetical protein
LKNLGDPVKAFSLIVETGHSERIKRMREKALSLEIDLGPLNEKDCERGEVLETISEDLSSCQQSNFSPFILRRWAA